MSLAMLRAEFPHCDAMFDEAEKAQLAATPAQLIQILLGILKGFSGHVSEIESFLASVGMVIPPNVLAILKVLAKLLGDSNASPSTAPSIL